jgi:hypothetical protein
MKDIICAETVRLCCRVYRDRLRALVLTGSLARNEGTFVKDGHGCLLLGDAEFLCLFDDHAPLPSDTDIDVIQKQIEECVKGRGLNAKITLSAVRTEYLRGLPPSIFAYELRNCGETLAGDRDALSLIPDFSPADIPLEDAWRLLANRIVEQLESVDELLAEGPVLSPNAHYRTVKLYLDMATSLLVFVGAYAPTYAERAKTLATLVDAPGRVTAWPFAIRQFASNVMASTQWKLSAKHPAIDVDRGFWERGVDYAQNLWQWELARLQGQSVNGAPAALMERWMRRQPLRQRLRGWAYVARRSGWHRSWRHWPQWLRQAMNASPRYLIYAAGSELLFTISRSSSDDGPQALRRPADALAAHLPLLPKRSRSASTIWHCLAADIVWNYNHFLVGTRA